MNERFARGEIDLEEYSQRKKNYFGNLTFPNKHY
ncbi:MAG: hypothetical protein NHB14_06040 [Desulfosporosinus sp.]|nr:hypothetical protein [Desulfosporosinus sp.]